VLVFTARTQAGKPAPAPERADAHSLRRQPATQQAVAEALGVVPRLYGILEPSGRVEVSQGADEVFLV
jgi:hypothetical protein